ncbi:DUF2634 domain-containing protein [Clostridium saccharobutylicum]|uniref:DUF2634 domain-containing protein n=1 Tax=Clostridium saccharobutylicum TaxID=169679 RepID=UPI00041C95F2|nr:DUF2634 domain-containing protein [Clostridium saccharobutylicum]AQR90574.1 hypothetical protein CLOSC_22950 [Clostridium saccharobutylicum]AQS00478.1 hypothetical protein CSACC_23020 [Clostridium saccharobutylicum]AQS10128.1 hypothetical protein CLOBY_22710 [Clostridium saccharobutylicum]AQS14461.1 hypothetical protein CLOSACC_23020 [Clostridium saccharobutylicum]MBA2906282.1 hypothetical protein [Clostridium saccharobutylicum]
MSSIFPMDYGSGSSSLTSTSATSTVKLLKEYAIDFETGAPLIDETGKFTIVEGLEAVKVRCWLALNIRRGRWFIYMDVGNKLKDLTGKDYNYVSLNIQTILEEALIDGIYITGIGEIIVTQKDDDFNVEFTVISIYGSYITNTDIRKGR